MIKHQSEKETDEFVDAFEDYGQLQKYRSSLQQNISQTQVKATISRFDEISSKTDSPMTITNYNTQITINNRYSGVSMPIDRISSPIKKNSLSSKVFKIKEAAGTTINKQEETKKEDSHRDTSFQESDLDGSYSQASEDTYRSIYGKTISESNTPNRASINPSMNTGESTFKADSVAKINFADSPGESIDRDLSSAIQQKKKPSSFSGNGNRKKADFLYKREATKLHELPESNFKDLILLQDIQRETFIQEATKTSNGSAISIWVVRFSPNEKFLATGGADGLLRIFTMNAQIRMPTDFSITVEPEFLLINPKPLVFSKHSSDIVDLDWNRDSKRVLTASIDNKAILWDITCATPLQIFEHSDIVPCTRFHPMVDDFCVTGCFDKILRIWDIADKKVVDWVQTADMITAMCFSPDKEFLLVGFFEGVVKIYRASQGKLKSEMEIECKNNPSIGKSKKSGKKVTEIFFFDENEFLVTTNDSRMRLFNFNSYEMTMKYKGNTNNRYQIRPNYNFQKELLIAGSENGKVFVWAKNTKQKQTQRFSLFGNKNDPSRNESYETFKPFSSQNVLCAMFIPYGVLRKCTEKLSEIWPDLYLDSLILLSKAFEMTFRNFFDFWITAF